MKADARAFCIALAFGLALASVAGAGCGSKSSHPPELAASPSGTAAESPVECSELVAASDELRAHVPGPLPYDGGAAQCIVPGAQCPILDSDAGVCDGGHAAALPGAHCQAGVWVGACTPLDAGKGGGDGGDGSAP